MVFACTLAAMKKRLIVGITGATGGALVRRAGEVVLKERRRLVLLPRETPLNPAHLRNMATVTEMGGIISPPVPAFYALPKSIDELVAHTVARVLDLFGIHSAKLARWQGMKGTPEERD